MPDVSVIIPAYNAARYLSQAIDSVLAQTYQDLEILVIDDGSTDDTPAVMAPYGAPVRYVRQANGGVSAARNHGIQLGRGRYVAFLDADDTWQAQKLAVQLLALGQQTRAAVCYSAFTVVDEHLQPLTIRRSHRRASALEDLLLRGNVVGSICTVIAERSLFAQVGGFDPQLSQCADWDMWVRLAAQTEFLYVDEPLVTYRQHPTNMSRNAPLLEKDSVRVLEKGFALAGPPLSLQSQKRSAFARNSMVLAGTYFHAGMLKACIRCAVRAVALDPRQLAYLLQFPLRRLSHRRQEKAVCAVGNCARPAATTLVDSK
jgi:glycosyltransferase involved in cell wall biosynthesis